MRDYNHTSSPVIDKLEAKFTSEYEKKYVIPRLHDLYEQVRYHFQAADAIANHPDDAKRWDDFSIPFTWRLLSFKRKLKNTIKSLLKKA